MENVARNNAQVIITAAFIFAVGIVAITALLNGLIFSQDIASRDDGVMERSVVGAEGDVRDTVGMAMTGDRGTPSDAADEYETYLRSFETVLQERLADNGRSISLTPVTETESWALGQRCSPDVSDCTFLNENGDDTWTAIDDPDDNPFEPSGGRNKMMFNVTEPDPSFNHEFRVSVTEDGSKYMFDALSEDTSQNDEQDWGMVVRSDIPVIGNPVITFEYNNSASAPISDTVEWDDIGKEYAVIEVFNGTSTTITGTGATPTGTINGQESISGWSDVNFPDPVADQNGHLNFSTTGDSIEGSYDIRVSSGFRDDEDELEGPCDAPANDGCTDFSQGDRELYAIGVVHNSSVGMNYYGDNVEHSTNINETLEQDSLILGDR
jgi:hypothetical protein